jgi:hypothetical protein
MHVLKSILVGVELKVLYAIALWLLLWPVALVIVLAQRWRRKLRKAWRRRWRSTSQTIKLGQSIS